MCMIATLNLPPDCHMLPSCPCQTLDSICTGHFGRIWSFSNHVANRFFPQIEIETGGPQILKTTSHHKNPTNCKRPTTLRPHHHGGTPIQSPSTALARRAVVLERPTFPDPSTTPSSFGQHPHHHQCFYRRNSF